MEVAYEPVECTSKAAGSRKAVGRQRGVDFLKVIEEELMKLWIELHRLLSQVGK